VRGIGRTRFSGGIKKGRRDDVEIIDDNLSPSVHQAFALAWLVGVADRGNSDSESGVDVAQRAGSGRR
jgi:hypothetical protein